MANAKTFSFLFTVLTLLLVILSTYLVISYTGQLLNGLFDFVSTNDFSRLQSCGVSLPPALVHFKTDLITTILPFLYVGFPILLLILAAIAFVAGFYYHKAKHDPEILEREIAEKELVRSVLKKVVIKPKSIDDQSVKKEDTPV